MCSNIFLLGRKHLPDNPDHISAFSLALSNVIFSRKWIYNRLRQFHIVKPIKQQELCSKDLNIQSELDWEEIYETIWIYKTTLRSFQIKLNLQLVVINIQLPSFG